MIKNIGEFVNSYELMTYLGQNIVLEDESGQSFCVIKPIKHIMILNDHTYQINEICFKYHLGYARVVVKNYHQVYEIELSEIPGLRPIDPIQAQVKIYQRRWLRPNKLLSLKTYQVNSLETIF